MPVRLTAFFTFFCFLLAGCGKQALIDQFASQEEQAYARAQVGRLQARDFAAIEAALDPSLAGPGLRPSLEKMAALVPAGPARSVQTVGAQKQYANGAGSVAISTEYAFASGWLLAHVVLAEKDGKRVVTGFNVYPRTQSLEEENAFRLSGKGLSQYGVLAAAVASVVLSICAVVVCARTRGLRRKWLWIVFILLGVGKLTVNWTTGELFLQPLSLQLFSASAMAQFGAPWLVSVALPLGAIVFLMKAAREQERAA